jgi:hypothetical protein
MNLKRQYRSLKEVDKMFLATKKEIEVELNRIKTAITRQARKEVTDNEDFYNFKNLTTSLEEDMINSFEAGFMQGYLEA